MSDDFSRLTRVKPNKGIAQWIRAKYVSSTTNFNERLVKHVMAVPYLMPATIIFVHGVNSEGEWYRDAAALFCNGLNKRLGRDDLKSGSMTDFDSYIDRFKRRDVSGNRLNRPIIPFYWGYKPQPEDLERYPGIHHRGDMSWGGGPFQNGTNSLLQFWQGGFKRKLLGGLLDLQAINPEFDRQLQDAPPRVYYIHAARRLARLIDTIREDFPNEPLNVVAHSQGNMITLCAMLYLQQRAPDTLLLNNAPFAFDTKITDWLAAAGGLEQVQSEDARFNTFRAIVDRIAQAKTDFRDDEVGVPCAHPASGERLDVHVQRKPECEDWQRQIGNGPVNQQGQKWYESELHNRDNRGKVFVNFSPHDRVVGVSAVEGIGWRGIPERLLSETVNRLPNVYQRVFARNSGLPGIPAVGAKQNYWFNYFHQQMVRENVLTGEGGVLVDSDGHKVQTENDYLLTHDNQPAYRFWIPPTKKALGILDVQGTPGQRERVWINAPVVPDPVVLFKEFDLDSIQFDGLESGNEYSERFKREQQESFATFTRFYVPEYIIEYRHDGQVIHRQETHAEVVARIDALAKKQVALTDHDQILRHSDVFETVGPVAQVLTYDLTVGQGYAFGDETYWQYLLNLADWRISDPYYATGILPDPGGFPPGLDPGTVGSK